MAEQDYEQQLAALRGEGDRLRAENARLRKAFAKTGVGAQAESKRAVEANRENVSGVTGTSSAEAKIALFRSLFRGREDVYAVRWQGSDGRSGYAPKAQRDWNAYLASPSTDRQKVDRETRTLLPLTDEGIRQHLRGETTIGVYPLLPDETCWFLAADFDKRNWREDASAFAATCREKGVPAVIERSRSGAGAHVWIFFARPVPAAMARKLGCALRLVGVIAARVDIADRRLSCAESSGRSTARNS